MDENQAEIKSKMILTSVLSLVGIVIVIGTIMYIAQKKLPEKYRVNEENLLRHIKDEPSPTPMPITGTFGMVTKDGKTAYRKGDTMTVVVAADSKGDKITGYDAVLRYDPLLMTLDKVTSLVEGMDLYQTETPSEEQGRTDLVVTGIQSVGQQDPFIFSNTALVEVSFVIKQASAAGVQLVFEPGQTTDSNLMNTQTQDILSSVGNITINTR